MGRVLSRAPDELRVKAAMWTFVGLMGLLAMGATASLRLAEANAGMTLTILGVTD